MNKYLLGGIALMICVIVLGVRDFNYVVLGETTSLNEYTNNRQPGDDSMSKGKIVTLDINKTYGCFAELSSTRQHKSTYFYIVELPDASLMAIQISRTKTDAISILDEITNDTLYSDTGASGKTLAYTGKLISLSGNDAEGYYNEYISELKATGYISNDANIRYLMINAGGDRIWAILTYALLSFMGISLIIVGIKSNK